MKIIKFGQSCLLIEEKGLRILTDPGSFSIDQNLVKNIDVILISHSHQDHLSLDSLKDILNNNPQAKIFTNSSVGNILEKENIAYSILENGQKINEKDVSIEAFGDSHEIIYPTLPTLQNTGFLIAEKLFFSGDAFTDINKKVEILALPVTGPFLKISESIDYALKINPKICIAIHDGIGKSPGDAHKTTSQILEQRGIKFIFLEPNKEIEL